MQGTPEAFQAYQKEAKHHLETWQEIVSYYYDGRLFTFFRVGEMLKGNPIIKVLTPHISKHMGCIFSGAASTSKYSLGLLRFGMKNGLRGEDPVAQLDRCDDHRAWRHRLQLTFERR